MRPADVTLARQPLRGHQWLILGAVLTAGSVSAVLIGRHLRDETGHALRRTTMVEEQLRGRGIRSSSVLSAMQKVARHAFVPQVLQPFAYEDRPLSIGKGQTISQPYIVALMSEMLRAGPRKKILEIGTGSGYQAAVLAELGCEVYSMEIIPELARTAANTLEHLGLSSIHLRTGDGYKGWPEAAPFDGIIVTCAPSDLPKDLCAQLAEGGRMIIPVGPPHAIQTLTLAIKRNGQMMTEEILPVAFVPMVKGARP